MFNFTYVLGETEGPARKAAEGFSQKKEILAGLLQPVDHKF
jgi:hypothetical protein